LHDSAQLLQQSRALNKTPAHRPGFIATSRRCHWSTNLQTTHQHAPSTRRHGNHHPAWSSGNARTALTGSLHRLTATKSAVQTAPASDSAARRSL
jgi:hypothetical protein